MNKKILKLMLVLGIMVSGTVNATTEMPHASGLGSMRDARGSKMQDHKLMEMSDDPVQSLDEKELCTMFFLAKVDTLEELVKTTALNLCNTSMRKHHMLALIGAIQDGLLPELKQLYLPGGALDITTFSDAMMSGLFQKLRVLQVLRCDEETRALAVSLAEAIRGGKLSELIRLDLTNSKIGPEGASALFQSVEAGGLKFLRELDLWNTGIGPEGATAFFETAQKGVFPCLTHLSLSFNEITPGGVMAFLGAVAAGKLSNLKNLDLSNCRMSEVTVKLLATIITLGWSPKLETLRLEDNDIKDETKEQLRLTIEKAKEKRKLPATFNILF